MKDYYVSLYASVDVRLDVVKADSLMAAARQVSEMHRDPQGTVYEVNPRDFSEPMKAVLIGKSAIRFLD